ncbi:Adenylate cyclase (EC [Olavius algarvensis Delta 1 endosymbiont]|nr:Adenylate cyclase (EC [Olavius algarvensis Delta 1 endosymbiont]
MTQEAFKRKLAAILSADVEGYSRLMDDDEEATVRTLTAYRSAIIDLVQQFRGRVVDAPGDNILAEFSSVVDAVNCAVEIQRDLAERNTDLEYNRKMEFRIGVNLGDVIEEDGRIYGDGVNIAARVESLAEAGGICISGSAYDQVANKLELGYDDLGKHQVKNISTPVPVYRVLSFPGAAAHRVVKAKETTKRKGRKTIIAGALVVIVVAALGIWQFYLRSPSMATASIDKMAHPLPDKPSIAVLAFDNLTGDPSQEYFSDGITEEIITSLSKVGKLFVIARNSSFTYKGKPVKIQQVSEELGVRYVLEGSVRKSGDRYRITAQLIDAVKGQHLWAESYDRNSEDIFEIQDEITMNIVTGLRVKLTEGEQARIYHQNYGSTEINYKILEALSLGRDGSPESLMRRGELAQEITDAAPEFAIGYRFQGWYHLNLAQGGISPQENLKKAFGFAQKAISLDESDGFAHSLLGKIFLVTRQYEKAIASGRRSVELYPNGAYVNAAFGHTLCAAGQLDEGITSIKRGIRLNPIPSYWYYTSLGGCYAQKERWTDAVIEFNKALERAPEAPEIHGWLSIAYVKLDRIGEGRTSTAKALELAPQMSVSVMSKISPIKNKAFLNAGLDAMRKAGYPE